MQALYTAAATAIGGRNGSIESSDGVLDMRLAYPKELGGPGGAATNPEQLFAAGCAVCFENAQAHSFPRPGQKKLDQVRGNLRRGRSSP